MNFAWRDFDNKWILSDRILSRMDFMQRDVEEWDFEIDRILSDGILSN